VDKFADRRAQLAGAALQTLAELGYARTSLREIAQNSQFSHGVLHYYFSDKVDLLTASVRQYEAACVTRYDEIVACAGSAEELKREFSAAMAQTLRTDAPMHRLWYDLRNQSLFEESFRADVLEIDQRREEMIWRVLSRYAEFAGVSVALSPGAAYAILDGLFQQALLHHLAGDDGAAGELRANVVRVLDTLAVRNSGAPSRSAAAGALKTVGDPALAEGPGSASCPGEGRSSSARCRKRSPGRRLGPGRDASATWVRVLPSPCDLAA
jgi:AcrR family transcriptional regulator